MANIYKWKISQLDAKIHEDGLDNVIYNVHWSLSAEDDAVKEFEKIRAVDVGCSQVVLNPESTFIPYEDLTKDIVIGWLSNLMDINKMKLALDKQIEDQKNPVDEYLTPDWD
tara:strand:- start:1 stop:336 length:336 start_codon:yes stop_codon:yes gene_type:complete